MEAMKTVTAAGIKAKALELGFDLCGVAPASDYPELKFFREWLDRGYAGEMAYLTRSADRRADVRQIIPSATSVIVTATVYNTDRPYSTERKNPSTAHIARYAWGDDYHEVIGERMERLLGWMRSTSDTPFDARAYVDTGPVQERVYAQYAGIGWIGKNTCVINAEKGSWIFLAEIVCSLDLEFDRPAFDQCGTCTLCIEACPTKAIVAPGVVDSNRCISYLTIEHRGDIPGGFHEAIGTHIYGCDICQEVCPWNATPAVSNDPAWQPRREWDGVLVEELAARSDDELRAAMRGSAMKRTKVAGLRRNLVVGRNSVGAVDD
jgi:epoxyqueuosine reductase